MGEVERTTRTIKDHGRLIFNKLPYSYLPSYITIHMVYFIVMWLNPLLYGKCICQKYSPREIVTGWHLGIKKPYRVVIGLYVEAHGDPNITNNMTLRTHEYITLGPTINIQGTHKVFCLDSGKVLKRIKIIPVVAKYRIINKVDGWGDKSRRE